MNNNITSQKTVFLGILHSHRRENLKPHFIFQDVAPCGSLVTGLFISINPYKMRTWKLSRGRTKSTLHNITFMNRTVQTPKDWRIYLIAHQFLQANNIFILSYLKSKYSSNV
jgi:hypothetical protein